MDNLQKEKDAALFCAILLLKELADETAQDGKPDQEKIARLRATLVEAANQAFPHMSFQ